LWAVAIAQRGQVEPGAVAACAAIRIQLVALAEIANCSGCDGSLARSVERHVRPLFLLCFGAM
jgi:hypothetical protein